MATGTGMRDAGTVAELEAAGGRRAVLLGAREVLLVLLDGEVRAIDRLCPHEGYALEDGVLEGPTLTCPWHGWRFDVRSGACLGAGEDVRAYRVEVVDGRIRVGADVEATAAERSLATEALLGALEVGDAEAAARRASRLLAFGAGPAGLATVLARYGGSHAGGALDPETAALADALVIGDALPEAVAPVLVDLAAALAERLARGLPRFPPEAASRFAWDELGVRASLAELVAEGDADEAEAVVLGMLAVGEAPAEAGLGAALGLARAYRGAWPLVVVRRAVLLAERLGPDVARAVLPVAVHGAASAPASARRPRFARAADAVAGVFPEPADVLAYAAAALRAGAAGPAEAEPGGPSLLGLGLALAHAEAAAWAVAGAGDAARPLALHAAALVRLHAGPAAEAGPPPPLVASLAAGPAETARGLAACLAATGAALRVGDPEAVEAAAHLLATPRRERFARRLAAGDDLEL